MVKICIFTDYDGVLATKLQHNRSQAFCSCSHHFLSHPSGPHKYNFLHAALDQCRACLCIPCDDLQAKMDVRCQAYLLFALLQCCEGPYKDRVQLCRLQNFHADFLTMLHDSMIMPPSIRAEECMFYRHLCSCNGLDRLHCLHKICWRSSCSQGSLNYIAVVLR